MLVGEQHNLEEHQQRRIAVHRSLAALVAPILLTATLALGLVLPSGPQTHGSGSEGTADALARRSMLGAGGRRRDASNAQRAAGLTALHFVDERRGWAAGQGFILATVDGGQTWAPQLPTGDPISSFSFVDARTGWAVGAQSFIGTTDGQRWERLGDADPPLRQVSFATPQLGWGIPAPPRAEPTGGAPATAPPARLLATSDGGQAWDEVDAPGPLQSVCRADAARGWALGDGRVWQQASADAAWAAIFTSPAVEQAGAPAGPGVGFGGEVQCVDGDTAWVLLTAPGGMMQIGWALYRTADAGATWAPVAQSGQFFPATGAPRGGGGWNRVRLAAVDGTTAYVVGTCVPCSPPGTEESGTVSLGVSHDAGQSWHDLPPLPDTFGAAIVSAPFAASFPTAERGWLIAPGSASVYATADGGATWTARPLDLGR
jgi:photosystem II stability/assembly factor-like uncharacterized protein